MDKDGKPLSIIGPNIRNLPGVGTLVIEHPTEEHEGVYQCSASNEYGTAMAVKTKFKAASKLVYIVSTFALAYISFR